MVDDSSKKNKQRSFIDAIDINCILPFQRREYIAKTYCKLKLYSDK